MITSSQNPKIKFVRSLLSSRKEREESGSFVVEGVRLAEEASAANFKPEMALFSSAVSERGHAVLEGFRDQNIKIEEVDADLLNRVSATRTSQGILLVLDFPQFQLPQEIDLVLALDNISDPGNMGTVLRSAWASGFQAILLTPGCVDVFSPKVVRAGIGAHFQLPIRTMTAQEIHSFCKQERTPALIIYLAESQGGEISWNADLRCPLCLIIGSEAEGTAEEIKKIADQDIYIPMQENAESYNAAVAAGILMYEINRQRMMK